ncbi:hypothetical protein [Anditalea andensis]|uniref:hypothetical protein n=1 Tax=Anditalea andensis TaxID=1048983 RepID=UPI0013E03BE8|nr:hypothetical protein [Anditalea andensis]
MNLVTGFWTVQAFWSDQNMACSPKENLPMLHTLGSYLFFDVEGFTWRKPTYFIGTDPIE